MFLLIICGFILSNTADVSCYDSDYEAIRGGWIKPHKVMATWFDAVEQCNKEGALLASPINEDILNHMISIIGTNGHTTPYFIGNNANIKSGLYVSLEGVPLSNMPVINMIEVLDPRAGLCMVMDHKMLLSVVSCTSRRPYMCYKARDDHLNMTECGTFDKKYIRLSKTGSCYKYYAEKVNWVTAYETCINEGAYLAVLNDNKEQLSVRDFIWDQNNSGAEYVHIGLLEWKVGGPWFSVHWEPFEKIYNRGFIQNELQSHVGNCQDHRGVLSATGKVSYTKDGSSNLNVYQFICEKDPTYIRFPLDNMLQGKLMIKENAPG
ncbi:unnamed protein product [Arctia plantaginis]|uniref:C-type lectin domain-containing protein n=1 Tax=Arctia plantaginis TaxID=874455 RepID=A0A8S0Z971_ARCPL|nr:unnamed protein product [Arctia plantaginis]